MEIKNKQVNSPIIPSLKTTPATSNEVKENKNPNDKKLLLSLAGLAVIGASAIVAIKMLKNGKTEPIKDVAEDLKNTLSKKITIEGKEFKGKFDKGIAYLQNGEKFTGKLHISYGEFTGKPVAIHCDIPGNYASISYKDGKIIKSVRCLPDPEEPGNVYKFKKNVKEYTYNYDAEKNIERKTVKLVNTQIIKDNLPERISAKISKTHLEDYLEAGSKYDDIIANGTALDALDNIALGALKDSNISHLLAQMDVPPKIMQANAKAIKNIHIENLSDIGIINVKDPTRTTPEKMLLDINTQRMKNSGDFITSLLKQNKLTPEILANNLKLLNKTQSIAYLGETGEKLLLQEKIDIPELQKLLEQDAPKLEGN